MKNLASSLNSTLERFTGLRVQPAADTRLSRYRSYLLDKHKIETVIDVGANQGQFGSRLRRSGYRGFISSFEPSPAFESLKQVVNHDNKWQIFNVALGKEKGPAEMNIASNGNLSSSLKRPTGILKEFPLEFQSGHKINMERLDDVVTLTKEAYLKIDVQGFEFEVLEGATKTMSHLIAVEFEAALTPLYEGEHTFVELDTYLREYGFIAAMIAPTHWSKTGELLSLDSIYICEDAK